MKKVIPWLIGLLLIGGVLYFLSCNCGSRFENKLNNKVAALVGGSALFAGANFDVDGRDVTLTGEMASEEAKTQLVKETQAIAGVRTVTDEMTVKTAQIAPVQDINFVLDKDGKKITLNGSVASQEEMDALLGMFEGYEVTNNLTIQNLPDDWEGKSEGIAALSKRFEKLHLGVNKDDIQFKGDISADQRADQIQLQLRKLFPNANISSDIAFAGLDNANRECQSQLRQILDNNVIQFAVGSSDIQEPSRVVIEKIVAAVQSGCHDFKLTVVGHTDNTGSAELNQTLSQSRADSVAALMMTLGVDSQSIESVGYGASRPIANNSTAYGRQLNRRIDIQLHQFEGE